MAQHDTGTGATGPPCADTAHQPPGGDEGHDWGYEAAMPYLTHAPVPDEINTAPCEPHTGP